jgi:hypothetical protein
MQARQACVLNAQPLLCLILVVVVVLFVSVSDQSICSVADLDGCEAQHDGSCFPLLAWLAMK